MTETMPAKLPLMLHPVGFKWNEYQEKVPAGVTIEQVTSPAFWRHVEKLLKRHDAITVLAEDCSYEVRMRVVGNAAGALRLRVLSVIGDPILDQPAEALLVVPEAPAPVSDLFTISNSKAEGWRVIDKVTKKALASNFGTKEEAEHAAANLAMARAA